MTPMLTDRQLDDVLDALAAPADVTAADLAALRDRVVHAVEAGAPVATGTPPALLTLSPVPSRRGRFVRRPLAILVVAAAVLVVAAVALALVQIARPSHSGPPGGRTEVGCDVAPGPADAPDRARTLLTARLAALGADDGAVTVDGDAVTIAANGVGRDQLAALCVSPAPALRPLIFAPYDLTDVPLAASPSLAAVPFPTSDDSDAYGWASHRDELAAAARAGCARPSVDTPLDRTVLACDRAGPDATLGYLLGPAVVAGSGVAGATAEQPGPQTSTWTVTVELSDRGSAALAGYTRQHNTGGASTSSECGPTTTRCADYLAVVVSGVVVRAPVVQSEITGSLQLSGALDEATATLLAAELGAGDLTLSVAN